jgi:predicted GNAT family N-acyltransferase
MDLKYREIFTINEFIDAIRLRVDVFINEQGFAPGWEPDEDDKVSKHFIVISNKEIVSTLRVREISKNEMKIERMVVKKDCRGQGVGTGLIKFVIKEIKKSKAKRIWLQSQVQAQKFYEDCGFKVVSKPVSLWGCLHIDMDYVGVL